MLGETVGGTVRRRTVCQPWSLLVYAFGTSHVLMHVMTSEASGKGTAAYLSRPLLQHELALEHAEVALHLAELHLLVLLFYQIHNSFSMHTHVQHVLVPNLQLHACQGGKHTDGLQRLVACSASACAQPAITCLCMQQTHWRPSAPCGHISYLFSCPK